MITQFWRSLPVVKKNLKDIKHNSPHLTKKTYAQILSKDIIFSSKSEAIMELFVYMSRCVTFRSRNAIGNTIYPVNRLKKCTSVSERLRLGRVSSTGRRGSMKVVVRELWSMKYTYNKVENTKHINHYFNGRTQRTKRKGLWKGVSEFATGCAILYCTAPLFSPLPPPSHPSLLGGR